MNHKRLLPALAAIAALSANPLVADLEVSPKIPATDVRHPAVYHYDKMNDALGRGNVQTASQHARLRTQHLELLNRFTPPSSERNLEKRKDRQIELQIKISELKAAKTAQQEALLQDKQPIPKPEATIQLKVSPATNNRIQEILEESQQSFESLPEIDSP